MIASIKFSHTKNPQPGKPSKYAMFDLEDSSGIMRTIIWPEQFAQHGHMVEADKILAVRGVIDKRPGSEEANFIVNELITLEQLAARFTKGMRLKIDERVHTVETIERLHEILRGYPGKCELQLIFHLTGEDAPLAYAVDGMRVELNPEMRSRVADLLGAGNIQLLAAPAQSAPKQSENRYGNGARGGNRPAMART
jgi:DNA polymerase-3 subunit alpha